MRPIVRTVNSRWPDSMRPPGNSMFCSLIAVAMSAAVTLKARILSGSTQTSTSRKRPPTISTFPTPSIDSISRLIPLSAMSVTSRKLRGAETAMRKTGVAAVSSFCTIGTSAVSGRLLTIRSTLLRTSEAATSAFFSSTKFTKTCETPSTDVERNSSMPLMVLTAPSTLSVISVSISCGDAPGLTTVIVIVGRSIFGNRSTPRDRKENRPTTVMLRMSMVANTGRRTQISASFCMAYPGSAGILPALLLRLTRSLPRVVLYLLPDCCPITQLIDIARSHHLVGRHPTLEFNQIALSLTRLHQALLGMAALDHEHVGRARNCAQRSLRHQHSRLGLRQENAHSCKLSRLQFSLRIFDVRFHGQCPRSCSDVRRNARHAPGKVTIRIRRDAHRDTLASMNLRDRLLRNIYADPQRIQVDNSCDFLLRRNIFADVSRPLRNIARHRRDHDRVTEIAFRQRELSCRGVDGGLGVRDRGVVLLGLVNQRLILLSQLIALRFLLVIGRARNVARFDQ